MAKRNQNSFLKRQKENKRKQEAQEKMARRQGKSKRATDDEEEMGHEESGAGEEGHDNP